MNILLSICILSYNRTNELERLLKSIDSKKIDEIEIIVKEDCAPNRDKVRSIVRRYADSSSYITKYIENSSNFGYDKNLRTIAKEANGKWVMFMGDDDIFFPDAIDKFIDFLDENKHIAYVLRRYRNIYKDGRTEEYRYSKKNEYFNSGEQAIVELFRRSVFISGFTFKKECFSDYDCLKYDGTLLFQLYILSKICLNYPSAYCDILITQCIEGGIPYFGNSKAEKDLYTSGTNSIENSLNFLRQVKYLTENFDKDNNTNITEKVLKSYSKYSYGFLHEHIDDGIPVFKKYAKEIKKMGMGDSVYFSIYYWMLIILGKKKSRYLIAGIKRIVGKTPRL